MASCDTISLTQPSAFTSCACTSVSLPLRPPPFRATPKPTWARAKSLYSKHTVIPINFPDIAAIDVRQIQKSASVVVLGKLMGSSPVTVAWKHGLELERESRRKRSGEWLFRYSVLRHGTNSVPLTSTLGRADRSTHARSDPSFADMVQMASESWSSHGNSDLGRIVVGNVLPLLYIRACRIGAFLPSRLVNCGPDVFAHRVVPQLSIQRREVGCLGAWSLSCFLGSPVERAQTMGFPRPPFDTLEVSILEVEGGKGRDGKRAEIAAAVLDGRIRRPD
ncbi:hypothetical protein HO173_003642 [Letharia columbiana]|uniref:Uncharacterized protein n=1 Tax=Letharia columbiana TaxID=112416 RepID=A0A8H6G0Z6_9LECA|nr:uncharacterized protein HO173_003642 [Letharia columbiana]KAF6238362.1 hypothetical protein HO173_003642 [Letharia columbiana]